MRIREIDFPEPLISAQKDGRLVVFAGAGVSMPSPSDLPDFRELANKVAGGILGRKDKEFDDRFLGRLQTKGVKVHKRVCEILSNPSSLRNGLHTDLVRLFRSPSDVRLVTTNFDTHFTRAAKEFFSDGSRVEVYEAPALPLGDNFNGIVHLHGSVDRPPER
jgi:NAD-dependent SIR2 family protein deacetylase